MRKQRRLSDEAAGVLRLFTCAPERRRFGLEIIKTAGIDSGSLYPILHRFEERRLLLSSWEDLAVATRERRRSRREYQLNPEMAETAFDLLDEWRRTRVVLDPAYGRLSPKSDSA